MNEIHPSCIIGDNVEIGVGNKILPFTIIIGPTKIGDNNIIGPNVVIGSPGQDTKNPRYDSSECYIEIGDNNIIREFTVIHKPCIKDITKIGSNVFLMHSVHIPHDAILHNDVVVTPFSIIGGISTLLRGANIGLSTSIHQKSVIGHFTMIAMGSTLTKNVRPFTTYIVNKPPRVNTYALNKFHLTEYTDEINQYVISGILPKSDVILNYVEEFEKLHIESKRLLYK